MNILAVDLWDKRCGLAVSRESIAFALRVIPRVELIQFLKRYFLEEAIDVIVVGLPYDLYNRDTKQLDKTKKFIQKLEGIFPEKQIIGHDERFSSFVASEGFDDHRDDIAAQCILQSYIDSRNK